MMHDVWNFWYLLVHIMLALFKNIIVRDSPFLLRFQSPSSLVTMTEHHHLVFPFTISSSYLLPVVEKLIEPRTKFPKACRIIVLKDLSAVYCASLPGYNWNFSEISEDLKTTKDLLKRERMKPRIIFKK
ncbi:hypothetical protein V8G54_029899 [Vigna mungo]|uniref:Uncharacterized protein n=1 Tax=Vigna mungo TaxID=3915 RepID=A0AAQ3MVH6_VIGMU